MVIFGHQHEMASGEMESVRFSIGRHIHPGDGSNLNVKRLDSMGRDWLPKGSNSYFVEK
jgi:hypothetical protein